MGLSSRFGPSARQPSTQKPNKKKNAVRDRWGWGGRKTPDPPPTGKGMGTEGGQRGTEQLSLLPIPAEEWGHSL